MRIFVSYNRKDDVLVEEMVEALRKAGHYIWSDALMHDGLWWSQILDEIERADAVVVALSQAYVESEACTEERRYAAAVHRPLLAVEVVLPMNKRTLPGELASLQIRGSADELVFALRSLPHPSPLPTPMPPRPPAPLWELAMLRDRIINGPTDASEQFAIIARFIAAYRSDDPDQRRNVRVLMVNVRRNSPHLLAQPAQLLDDELNQSPPAQPPDDEPNQSPVRSGTFWPVIVGAALGGIGIVNFLTAVKVYQRLPTPFGFVGVHLLLNLVGLGLCVVAVRRHLPGVRIALAVCAVGLLAMIYDAAVNGIVKALWNVIF